MCMLFVEKVGLFLNGLHTHGTNSLGILAQFDLVLLQHCRLSIVTSSRFTKQQGPHSFGSSTSSMLPEPTLFAVPSASCVDPCRRLFVLCLLLIIPG